MIDYISRKKRHKFFIGVIQLFFAIIFYKYNLKKKRKEKLIFKREDRNPGGPPRFPPSLQKINIHGKK
jgi:hypothetical protein